MIVSDGLDVRGRLDNTIGCSYFFTYLAAPFSWTRSALFNAGSGHYDHRETEMERHVCYHKA